MHMIGISGRCSAEHRSSSGLYPFPFDARARRGCTSISASKTGCQWCRALVSETHFTMRWAYLILVSGLPLDFVDPGLEPTDFLPCDVSLFSECARVNLVSDDCTDDEHDDDPASDKDLRDRLRERHHVLFFQPVRRIDSRKRGQVLEYVDEDVVLEARRDRDSFRVLCSNDFHSFRFSLPRLGSRCGGLRHRRLRGCGERRSTECICATLSKEGDHAVEQASLLGG